MISPHTRALGAQCVFSSVFKPYLRAFLSFLYIAPIQKYRLYTDENQKADCTGRLLMNFVPKSKNILDQLERVDSSTGLCSPYSESKFTL